MEGRKGKIRLKRPRQLNLDPMLAPDNSATETLSQYKRETRKDHWPRGHLPTVVPPLEFSPYDPSPSLLPA